MLLEGKVAYVTGAGSGIGKGAALIMAKEGAKIAILSRTEKQLKEVAGEIEALGGEALIITGDVSDPEQMQSAVQQTARHCRCQCRHQRCLDLNRGDDARGVGQDPGHQPQGHLPHD